MENMIEIESRVRGFIQRYNLIQPGESIVVGVSGGADSVCLLCLLQKCQNEFGIKLHIAHLNHGLRGIESEVDARYVAELARFFSIPITIDKQDAVAYKTERKCSLEEAARELRYAFFAQVAAEVGARRVAIGHTQDDQVETILMHIIRGTGTSGLRGLEPCSPIPSKSYQLSTISHQILAIRPLLQVTKEETLSYCQECELKPCVDSSNVSLSFLRNRLRLELLPLLREYNPNVDEAVVRLAEIARDDSNFVEEQALGLWNEVARQENGIIYLDRANITTLPVALQRRLIRLAITRLLGDIRDVEATHIEAARSLLSKPVGRRFSLPHGLVCRAEYGEIVIMTSLGFDSERISSSLCPFSPIEGTSHFEAPGEAIIPGWRVTASVFPISGQSFHVISSESKLSQRGGGEDLVAQFDLQKTGTELLIRKRKPGDKFQPLGMSAPKKLKDFMIDTKIPLLWRDHIPIVCSTEQIIWVTGYRIDDRVRVTKATKDVLRLELIKHHESSR